MTARGLTSSLLHGYLGYCPAQNTRTARGGDCYRIRASKESTNYGRVRTRNCLTVPSRHAVSPFAPESS